MSRSSGGRSRCLGTLLTVALVFPFGAAAQEREEGVRSAVDRVGVARVTDGEIASIATAIQRGASPSQVEASWRTFLERRRAHLEQSGHGMREAEWHGLTLRVLESVWESAAADLARVASAIDSSEACPAHAPSIESGQQGIEPLVNRIQPRAADIESIVRALEALSEALALCEQAQALAGEAPSPATRPTGNREVREPEKKPEAEEPEPPAELTGRELQAALQNQAQTFQMMASLLRALHETTRAFIDNTK